MKESIQSTAVLVRERLAEILEVVPDIGSSISTLFSVSSPTGSAGWHGTQLLIGVIFTAIGYLAKGYIESWGRRQFEYLFNPVPQDRAEKISYLLTRFVLQFLAIAIMFAVAALLAIIFQQGEAQRADFLLPINTAVLALFGSLIFRTLLAPDVPSHRLLVIDDAGAKRVYRGLTTIFAIGFGLFEVITWLAALGLDSDTNALFQIFGILFAVILLSGVSIKYRHEIGSMICGGDTGNSKGARLITNTWYIIAVLYFFSAWAISSIRYILELPSANGLAAAPIIALLIALLAYAVLLLIIDYLGKRGKGKDQAASSRVEPDAELTHEFGQKIDGADSAGNTEVFDQLGAPERKRTPESEEISKPDELPDDSLSSSGLIPIAEHGAAVLSWASGLFFLLWRWGVDLSADGFLVNTLDILLVLFAGWFIYKAIGIMVSRKIASEGGVAAAEPGEEGGGHGGVSRIAMLLTLFRKTLLVTVSIIVGLIVLSELGIDIGPLFAGAGVVGLAVGFGAQSLVKDIFSGAFFLMDDAFRVGEYIDVGSVKGTVEKISIRSMQLRHHLGPLHTIPFGEITHLTNFARDWVMMKLKLRVTYDTDIDRVRKLVKKLGQDLLEHPEIGDTFLQPLKSQGVYSMEDDNAIIIRVKFMTRPGEQFVTRKVVYQEIRNLFEREGIHFATKREVVVRVAHDEEEPNPQTEAIGAAAAEAVRQAAAEDAKQNNP